MSSQALLRITPGSSSVFLPLHYTVRSGQRRSNTPCAPSAASEEYHRHLVARSAPLPIHVSRVPGSREHAPRLIVDSSPSGYYTVCCGPILLAPMDPLPLNSLSVWPSKLAHTSRLSHPRTLSCCFFKHPSTTRRKTPLKHPSTSFSRKTHSPLSSPQHTHRRRKLIKLPHPFPCCSLIDIPTPPRGGTKPPPTALLSFFLPTHTVPFVLISSLSPTQKKQRILSGRIPPSSQNREDELFF